MKSLTLGCDGTQQRERFLSVPMGTLRQSLHNGIQASGGGGKWIPGVPVKSLPLGCDGAQQRVRFLSVPMGTLQLSLHSEIQASEGKSGHEAFL